MTNMPVLVDADTVAKALSVSRYTVRRWASIGKLRRVKIGARTLFDPADVARLVERAKQTQDTSPKRGKGSKANGPAGR